MRHKLDLQRPTANLTVYYTGMKMCNKLPLKIKHLVTKRRHYEVSLKEILLTHIFYSVDKFINDEQTVNKTLNINCYIVLYVYLYTLIHTQLSVCTLNVHNYLYVHSMYKTCASEIH
jgi:hypothetical protein